MYYAFFMFQTYIHAFALLLADYFQLSVEEMEGFIEIPPENIPWDLAFPCFKLAGMRKTSPNELATSLAAFLKDKTNTLFTEFIVLWGYVNAHLSGKELIHTVLSTVLQENMTYGTTQEGKGKTIVVEFSSPNIAKPFSVWHLRSTVIGNSLAALYESQGYSVVRINHIGDWWTQFWKLLVAFWLWGNEEALEQDPIHHLLDIYVRFHDEAEQDLTLEDKAREAFKALEEGNKAYYVLWEKFRTLSLKKFQEVYEKFSISFDYIQGESFYNDRLEATYKNISTKAGAVLSQWAQIVDLTALWMPPLLLKKSDGASTYHLRDLSAALYRIDTYHPTKILYVVWAEQKLHFQQLFAVLWLAWYDTELFTHVDFWLFRFKEGKMSSRKGNVVFLEDVLEESYAKALTIIAQKNADLPAKEVVAHQIAVWALIFWDLINDRTKFIDFDLDSMISFDWETWPYVQYTHARCCSLLKKWVRWETPDYTLLFSEEEKKLAIHLSLFSLSIEQAIKENKPSIVARYVLDLAHLLNTYYGKEKILDDDKHLQTARLSLIDATRCVLENWLKLLGIAAPKEM